MNYYFYKKQKTMTLRYIIACGLSVWAGSLIVENHINYAEQQVDKQIEWIDQNVLQLKTYDTHNESLIAINEAKRSELEQWKSETFLHKFTYPHVKHVDLTDL